MAIRIERFPIGKETNAAALERFLLEQSLVPDDIVNISLSPLGQDAVEYIITYEDSGAPRVTQTVPNQGDNTVAPGTTLTFIFNKAISPVTTADVEIENLTTSTILSDTLYTLDNSSVGDRRGVLRIADVPGYLVDDQAFRITLLTTVTDTAGNTMLEPFDLIIGASTGAGSLLFDGGDASSFSNPSLNRYETIVTTSKLTYTHGSSRLQLTKKAPTGSELDGWEVHGEEVASPPSSFRVVLEHGNHLITPEPTGILPTGMLVDWIVLNGL